MKKTMIIGMLVALAALCLIIAVMRGSADNYGEPRRTIHAFVIEGADVRERVRCEFDEPLKHVSLIMHWYDTNEDMYSDYILLADPAEHAKIWGWSNCAWQEEDDAAWCDVYAVKPAYVHADMYIDTIGHEVFHGACGGFHD